MARYTPDSKERVRDAVDMIDLVGTRTELKRAGASRYTGLCPFHEERSPSFGIDPSTKLYHCFGCGVGGDCFTFVQELEGLEFTGAMEFLADRYNVTLEAADDDPHAAEKRRRHDRLLELLERTAAFYVRMLWESDEAASSREYLAQRGLQEPILREFRVGYAPSAWDKVLTASRRSGYTEDELAAAGLVSRSRENGRVYDRFRRRIMFPLCDRRGAVLGFGARAAGADQQPKYLNSADGELYHKGRHVFGFHNARAAAAKAGTVILAEGYTDVIALHQAGLANAVGLMGTALTPEQVSELARMAKVVQLALDADGAGQEAMLRAARVARGKDLDLRIVPLPRRVRSGRPRARRGAAAHPGAGRGQRSVRELPGRPRARGRRRRHGRGQGPHHRGAAAGVRPGDAAARGAARGAAQAGRRSAEPRPVAGLVVAQRAGVAAGRRGRAGQRQRPWCGGDRARAARRVVTRREPAADVPRAVHRRPARGSPGARLRSTSSATSRPTSCARRHATCAITPARRSTGCRPSSPR